MCRAAFLTLHTPQLPRGIFSRGRAFGFECKEGVEEQWPPIGLKNDNLKRTVQQLLIDALNEMEVDFYRLDTVVQATLLDEAMQVGVQHSLVPLMRIKAVMEAANADENFRNQMIIEIYRERGKTPLQLPRADRDASDYTAAMAQN